MRRTFSLDKGGAGTRNPLTVHCATQYLRVFYTRSRRTHLIIPNVHQGRQPERDKPAKLRNFGDRAARATFAWLSDMRFPSRTWQRRCAAPLGDFYSHERLPQISLVASCISLTSSGQICDFPA